MRKKNSGKFSLLLLLLFVRLSIRPFIPVEVKHKVTGLK